MGHKVEGMHWLGMEEGLRLVVGILENCSDKFIDEKYK